MLYVAPFNNPYLSDDDYDAPDTWPSPVKATLTIVDEYQPLFTSASWVIRARVDGTVFAESEERDDPHEEAEVKQWARAMIRKEYVRLSKMGVDALSEYTRVWGGSTKDIG